MYTIENILWVAWADLSVPITNTHTKIKWKLFHLWKWQLCIHNSVGLTFWHSSLLFCVLQFAAACTNIVHLNYSKPMLVKWNHRLLKILRFGYHSTFISKLALMRCESLITFCSFTLLGSRCLWKMPQIWTILAMWKVENSNWGIIENCKYCSIHRASLRISLVGLSCFFVFF